MTPAALAQFRARVRVCEMAAYVDIGAGTVLAADGALTYPQEYLDALCTCAGLILGAPAFVSGREMVDHAVISGPTAQRVFVRALDDPDHVLCCICAPHAPIGDVLEAGRDALSSLTRVGAE